MTTTKAALKKMPIDDLERLALDLREDYRCAENDLGIHLHSPDKDRLLRIRNAPPLHDVLFQRKARLNRAFTFQPETTARFVAVNDLLQQCIAKARIEARRALSTLRRRIVAHDAFLTDYEFALELHPFTGNTRGILELLERILHASSAQLRRCETNLFADPGGVESENWNTCDGLEAHESLSGHTIGYAMHELHAHSLWSLPDILQITHAWVDVTIIRQHCSELTSYLPYSVAPTPHTPKSRTAHAVRLFSFMHLSLRRSVLSDWPAAHPQSRDASTLDLGFNRLERLPPSAPYGWPALTHLWIHQNRLRELPADLSAFAGLRELDLSYNQLESLPESIGQLTSLEVLHLQGNRLRTLPASFALLTRLRRLNLHENALTHRKRPAGCLGLGFAGGGCLIQNVTNWITNRDVFYLSLSMPFRQSQPTAARVASSCTGATGSGRPGWSLSADG